MLKDDEGEGVVIVPLGSSFVGHLKVSVIQAARLLTSNSEHCTWRLKKTRLESFKEECPLVSSKVAGWKVPELNGGFNRFNRKITFSIAIFDYRRVVPSW